MKRVASLCWRCIKDYQRAGYDFSPFFPFIKEPCDLCTRIGFTGVLHETIRQDKERSAEDGG